MPKSRDTSVIHAGTSRRALHRLAVGAMIGMMLAVGAAAEAQTAAPPTAATPVLIPAPPGSAQQDLQQPDHATDPGTGHTLVWDAGKKSWIDPQTGQALGFQGALAKDGTVIPAPAPSISKSGAKTQAKQDADNPEHAYNSVTGQDLVWDRSQSAWIDTRSKKNAGFQGAFVAGATPPGASTGAPMLPGGIGGFGFGFGGGTGGGERDKLGTRGNQDSGSRGNQQLGTRGIQDLGNRGGQQRDNITTGRQRDDIAKWNDDGGVTDDHGPGIQIPIVPFPTAPPNAPTDQPPGQTVGPPPITPTTPPPPPPTKTTEVPPPNTPVQPPPTTTTRIPGKPVVPTTQEKPPTPHTTDNPPPHTPDEPPPPHVPEYPPPIYGHNDVPFCCGMVGNFITYPITTDPMNPPKELEAPQAPAVGGEHVYLHDGAFFFDQTDLNVQALFYDINWTRHWRGDATFKGGGVMGHGWDFAFNKRIVPKSAHPLKNGLSVEVIGFDTPELMFYDGLGRGERYVEFHSERREVHNFDATFFAYTTTYKSPPGQFHEIERYVLVGAPSEHPFREHPNVEKTEMIFYVLRAKDGTRYVFNCRGQMIYVLSRNDSKSQKVRIDLRYDGKLSPLTQNHTLSQIIDASGRQYSVATTSIDQGNVFTNIDCKVVSGKYPIPRIKSISGPGISVEYTYKGNDSAPILETAKISAGGKERRWQYEYNGDNHITTVKDPAGCAGGGKPYLTNTYSGPKVTEQTLGDMKLKLGYQGSSVVETDALGNKREYGLAGSAGFHVVGSLKITDHDASHGGPWTTRYEHNGDTQVTEITYPAQNGVTYRYDGANRSVILGPIRDWFDHGLTYESDLARGNLLSITHHGGKSVSPAGAIAGGAAAAAAAASSGASGPSSPTSVTTSRDYEQLYNQAKEATDALGQITRWRYTDYDTPRNRGNPLTVELPPVLQPDTSSLARPPVVLTYNKFGQPETTDEGGGQLTRYVYDEATGYVKHMDLPGGAFEDLKFDARGNIKERKTQDGTVTYSLDGFGQIKTKTVDPDGLALVTTYDYDATGNPTETTIEVKDTFGSDGTNRGIPPTGPYKQTLKTEYDNINRKSKETVTETLTNLKTVTTYKYSTIGDLERVEGPPLDEETKFVTTHKYDARHLLLETVTAAETAQAETTQRSYDDNGNLTKVTTGSGDSAAVTAMKYDGLDRVGTSTSPLGAVSTYVYDAAENIVDATVAGAKGTLSHTSFAFDDYQHVIKRTVDTGTGGTAVWQWNYSPQLTLAKSVNPDGGETVYAYDAQRRVLDVTDAAGDTTHNTYDAKGNLTKVDVTAVERRVDPGGNDVEELKTRTTTTAYDSAGRIVKVQGPAGEEQRFLDSLGRSRATSSQTGLLSMFTYDGLGRLTRMENPLAVQTTTYTLGGLPLDNDAPQGHTKTTYYPDGRVSSRTDLRTNGKTTYSYKNGRVTIYDPNGTLIITRLNPAGQPLSTGAVPVQMFAQSPDIPDFRLVQGTTVEHFDYDEAGRVTLAWNANDPDHHASEVRRKYDGLSRVVEEVQIWNGMGQTVKHEYADDSSWAEVTYPELASNARLRLTADLLGRINSVSVDGEQVATYTYTGIDRLASRWQANGIETRFAYDDKERLSHVQLVRVNESTGTGGETLWSALAEYGPTGVTKLTEFNPASGKDPETILRTQLARDTFGRVTSSTTSLSKLTQQIAASGVATAIPTTGTTAVSAEVSGTFTQYENGRLRAIGEVNGVQIAPPTQGIAGQVVNQVREWGFGGDPVQSLRVDRYTYDDAQRVKKVATSGGFAGKTTTDFSSVDDVAAGAKKASRVVSCGSDNGCEQNFQYDANGNLVSDGRYLYAYDYKNRLIEVQDRWSPYGYDESVRFNYDPFDRRIGITPDRILEKTYTFADTHWVGGKTWMIYDGRRVIADIWRERPKAGTTLAARYFHGARSGELVRMDRRPEDYPTEKPFTFYMHEDINGTIRLVSGTDGRLFHINNELPPGGGKTASEQPPGDRLMISLKAWEEAEGDVGEARHLVRAPYVGADTRVDGFAATNYRDDHGRAMQNYRHASNFVRASEHDALHTARTAEQNKYQVVVGIIVAAPIAASLVAVEGISVAAMAKGAFEGAALNVGFGVAKASFFGEAYTPSQLVEDLLQGAAFGAAGGAIGRLGLTAVAEFGANLAATTTIATAWDVGLRGADPLSSLSANLVTGAAMSAAFHGIGWAGGKAKMALLEAATEAVETLPRQPAAVKEATNGIEDMQEKAIIPGGRGKIDPEKLRAILAKFYDVPLKDIELEPGDEISAAHATDTRDSACALNACNYALQRDWKKAFTADESWKFVLEDADFKKRLDSRGGGTAANGMDVQMKQAYIERRGFSADNVSGDMSGIEQIVGRNKTALPSLKLASEKHAVSVIGVVKTPMGGTSHVRFFDVNARGYIIKMTRGAFQSKLYGSPVLEINPPKPTAADYLSQQLGIE